MTIIESDVRRTTDEEEDVDLTIEVGTWKMDPSLKQRWVTALRSGKYPQGKYDFERDGQFCVLGVLCDVAGQPTGVRNFTFVDSVLPDKATVNTLFLKNDAGWSFDQLADYIEANY